MRWRRVLVEVPPVVLLLAAAAVYLGPALAHGWALGPFDILSTTGLTAHAHPVVHNWVGSDEIEEFLPWQDLAWRQVHAGHLPLWNPDNLLGLPLAFDFQSAPFSLPVAVSYLFPLPLAHDAAVVTRLLLGGTGAYVLGRVLGLGRWPGAFAGLVFELSGAFTIWLGAYEAGVYCFLGWILAASVVLARGRHRVRGVAVLAVVLALALYGGEPQIALLVLVCLGVMAVALAVGAARSGPRAGEGSGAPKAGPRVLVDHALALLAGVALAAPVYLPGIQLALASARSTGPYVQGLPLYDLTHLLFTAYDGSPTNPTQIVGPDNLYVSMLYVGTVPAALAVVGLLRARRQAAVAGLAALTGLVLLALFVSPVADLARAVPVVRVFRLLLATTVVDFGLAMLAGCGLAALMDRRDPVEAARAWRVLGWTTALLATTLLVLGIRLALNADHLDAAQQGSRAGDFALPAAGVAVLGVLAMARRAGGGRGGRWLGRLAQEAAGPVGMVALVGVAGGLLVQGGAGIWSSTSRPFARTPGVAALQEKVGGALVGIGSCATNAFPAVGVVPNDNAAYGVVELAGFDPILPKAYAVSYGRATGGSTKVQAPPALFCPALTSAALARRYGAAFILEPPGAPGPPGTSEVARPGGEGLYAVPGSGRAALLTPVPGGGTRRRVEPATQPSPSSWRVAVDAPAPSRLELAVTAVPGWHASIDGRPLALSVHDGVLLSARVPGGRSTVTLSYWPTAFTLGLALAGAAAGGLVGAGLVAGGSRRRRRRRDEPEAFSPPGKTHRGATPADPGEPVASPRAVAP